jgi:GT2 family glycosyltransferase
MTPDISIVVPAHNNWWLTRHCLHELDALRASSPVRFETIVVDSASSDQTPERLKEFDWVRVLRLDPRANFGDAANAGARIAEAPIVLFLNNDAYPLGDPLVPLVAAFARDDVAIAGSALFYEDGVTQGAGCVLLPNAHWFLSHRNLPPDLEGVRRSRDAIVVPGAACAVRATWFAQSGGFDPTFRNGFEDTDLCLRAHSEGLVVRYVAESRFAHYEGATAGRFDWEDENERRFYERWSSALAAMPRTQRGEVSAIVLRQSVAGDPVGAAVLRDLSAGMRSYGHPIVGGIAPWRRFDRRFRIAAGLAWNVEGEALAPCVAMAARNGRATLRTHGAIELEVPWMPCADPARAAELWLRCSDASECTTIAVLGEVSSALLERVRERSPLVQFERLETEVLLERRERRDVAAVLIGRADSYGFGALLAAYGGNACVEANEAAPEQLARLVADRDWRARAGAEAVADARRRGDPRRSAMRVLDLARVARFGLERPGSALANAPIRLASA